VTVLSEFGEFHHTGLAARHFSDSVQLLSALGFAADGPEFEDHAQGIKGLFMTLGGNRVEVLANLPGSTMVDPWLGRAGLVPYHLAYLVPDLDSAIDGMTTAGMRLVRSPIPAVAFRGRSIAFLLSRQQFLIELIESEDG
jgi:methylmalonyl-CoA/ethylmalonyl-CoA epimerase